MRVRSLKRNFAATIVGNGTYAVTQFLILVVLAHTTNTEEVGRYGLALAITAPVFLLAGLKLRQVQVTDARGENRTGDFLALRLITSTLALSAIAVISFAAGLPRATEFTILAVALFKAVEGQVDILYGAIARLEQMQYIARSQVVRGVLGAGAFALTVWWTGNAALGALSLALVNLLPVLFNLRTLLHLGVSTSIHFEWRILARLALLALPLGLSVALGSLATNIPKYLIQYFSGSTQLGIFAAIVYALVATSLVAGALSEAASPRLSNLVVAGRFTEARHTIRKLCAFGLAIGLIGILLSILLGRPALRILFGAEYAQEWHSLVILMVAAALQYVTLFFGTAINAVRLFKVQAPVTAATVIVVGCAGWALIPTYGLDGAAWSIVAAKVVQFVCYVSLYRFWVSPRLAGP